MRVFLNLSILLMLVISHVNLTAAEGTPFYGVSVLASVPQPEIPKAANGDACIAPTAFMRRNHMELLKHDRDKTVHFGDRRIEASLKQCVSCHAVNGVDNEPITAADPKHFCRSCHDYVAVKIDCFDCHASRPDVTTKSKLSSASKDTEALAAYVKGLTK